MSRPMSNNRNLPLAPIPESSQVHFTPPPPPPPPLPLSASSDAMAAPFSDRYVGGMPEGFWYTPSHAACVFSTQNGRLPKRQLPKDEPWPMPIMRSNLQHDVEKAARNLAKQFPERARGVTTDDIEQWYHLYRYWDAVDIWTEGAGFCYWVLHCLAMANKELDEEQPPMIDEFAKEWITAHEELVINHLHTNDLLAVFDEFDRSNLVDMRPKEVDFLRNRLSYHRYVLLSRVQELRRQAAQLPRILERGPAGILGPYPGLMYPPPPSFPHGPPMIDPRTPVQSLAQGVPASPKPNVQTYTYNQFVESQRHLHSRFGPRVPPTNVRNENRPMEGRPRGWSNDTARNGRGGKGWNNRNGRAYVPATPQPSPPRPMYQTGSEEPIYVLTSQNPSPQNQQTNTAQRVFSDPVSSQISQPQAGQRALSDSPAGRGTFNSQPATATPLGRRASTNDVDSRPKYVPEKMSSPQESQAAKSDNSTPRAPISNDARVLEAMENQECRGLLFNAPPEQRSGLLSNAPPEQRPALLFNAPPEERPGFLVNTPPEQRLYNGIELQRSMGGAGAIHQYFYTGPPRRLDLQEQNNRSIFIGTSPYELFVNHKLKEFCSQCGEVDNTSFLADKGNAFVAFVHESSVEHAIQRFNGELFGGYRLVVNRPRTRPRRDSYSSQRSYASNRTVIGPRDAEQGPPYSRRSSFREPYNHVRNISRNSVDGTNHVRNFSRQSNDTLISPPRIEGRLMSSVSEVIQHNAALNRMGQPMPLESIENHYGRNQQTKPNHEYRHNGDTISQTSQYNRKENSPIKSDRPPKTPSRKSSFSSQAGGQGSKRKNNNKRAQVSRQNSSTSAAARPTPAATPTKSRPSGILTGPVNDSTSPVDYKKDYKATSTISADMNNQPEASEEVTAEKPKQKGKFPKNKKKKNAPKNEDENATSAGPSSNSNASFATESSSDAFEVTSPVGTESSMGFTSKSTSTSFSDLLSRKPSVVSSISTPPMSETPEEDDNVSMKAMSPTPEIDEKSITPKPSQTQLSSSKTPDTVVKQRSTSDKAHSKMENVVSTGSTASSSMRKADAKLAKSDGEAESPEAKINLDDQKEFPALGPMKSPLSSVADGKRPAAHAAAQRPPMIGSLSERVVSGSAKNQVKPAVPVVAVPRSYMQRQAPQPVLRDTEKEIDLSGLTEDGLGSRTWPFVKRVKPL